MRIGTILLAIVFAMPTTQLSLAQDPSQFGQKVYVDPETGELISAPVVISRAVPPRSSAYRTSHLGLYEVEISIPGGGVKVDLQGRFQSTLSVTLDPSGGFKFTHTKPALKLEEAE